MRSLTFDEINQLENGEPIPSFTGKIKKVFEQKTDVGQFGQWWLQNIILVDANGSEITMTWCCEDAFEAKQEGSTITVESGRDKKDQLAGVKKEIRNKNGKHYESVKVDERSKITFENLSDGEGASALLTERPDKVNQDKSPSSQFNGVDEARQQAMQAANLMLIAMEAGRWAFMQYTGKHNVDLPDAHYQAMCSTLFIHLDQAGYVKKMPTKPIKEEL